MPNKEQQQQQQQQSLLQLLLQLLQLLLLQLGCLESSHMLCKWLQRFLFKFVSFACLLLSPVHVQQQQLTPAFKNH